MSCFGHFSKVKPPYFTIFIRSTKAGEFLQSFFLILTKLGMLLLGYTGIHGGSRIGERQ